MLPSRRRSRRHDPLASPKEVSRILNQLRRNCPGTLPNSDRQCARMLESVRHYVRRPAIDENRGRPRRWTREDVAKVAKALEKVMGRKNGGRVSASSFISLYLPILRYPVDIVSALSEGEINIREATYLVRLTPERMGCSWHEARLVRTKLIKAHLLRRGSQSSLRLRVKAMLGELPVVNAKPVRSGREKADELLERNPYDSSHLFYEEIQLLVDAMQQVEPDELKGKKLDAFLRQIDKLLSMLQHAKEQNDPGAL